MKKPRLVAPSLVDKLVGVFSPAAQLRRQVARTALASANGGYVGGKRDRRSLQNFLPDGGSANADTSPDLPTLRARSRDLRRNTPIATGAIATRITNIIGEGLRVLPQIDGEALGLDKKAARAWNKKARTEFALASWTADFTGVHSFEELQALVFGSADESGDVLVIRRYRKDPNDTYGTKLQVIEADRLSNPNNRMDSDTVVGGVETSPEGVVLAYHISDRHPGDVFRKAMSWRRVPAHYNDGRPICLHLFKRLRPDQARGVPFLAPVIEAIKQLGTYSEAEIEAAVLAAFFTVFVKTPDGPRRATRLDRRGRQVRQRDDRAR
ncbi:MAG: phage portal protein [Rhizobium sp.]|nr:phage portal protein [Rhizobium sp.]